MKGWWVRGAKLRGWFTGEDLAGVKVLGFASGSACLLDESIPV